MPHIPIYASSNFEGISKRGLYGDVVSELDWSAGEILKTLRDLKLDKNTLVIFTSDNGPWLVQKENGGSAGSLKGGKGTTWEGGQRVPMIAWWPGQIPSGQINETLATSLDLLPTIAKITDVALPKRKLDGQDIMPVLKNEKSFNHNPFVFYRGNKILQVLVLSGLMMKKFVHIGFQKPIMTQFTLKWI